MHHYPLSRNERVRIEWGYDDAKAGRPDDEVRAFAADKAYRCGFNAGLFGGTLNDAENDYRRSCTFQMKKNDNTYFYTYKKHRKCAIILALFIGSFITGFIGKYIYKSYK